nr:PREDICTED: chaperone protein ClpC, chloroplastic-like isoform X2 [Daucus carota subsp. sativus]XP_017228387.1 PREDICTED: chaperone protein ClpC, chloroplastic-like isoform X2 [Daucus carota subsp. sativus]
MLCENMSVTGMSRANCQKPFAWLIVKNYADLGESLNPPFFVIKNNEDKLDPVVGRQPQIERYWAGGLKISLPNSRARCWKTAIVEGTAQRIENGDVPEKLEVEKVFVCLIQGSSFGSGCLRCCTEDWIREFLSSLSKSEMHLEDSYNLACVLTLPPYQRKDYGKFLIAFCKTSDSYIMSLLNFLMQ